jgi:hypothetical protein
MRDSLADEFDAYSLFQSQEMDFAFIGIAPPKSFSSYSSA